VRVKLDENLSRAHRLILEDSGHDVDDVRDEHAAGAPDARVWKLTSAARRFFVTLDLDFSDVRKYPPGSHAGILLLRTGHPSRDVVAAILRRVLREQGLDSLAGCLAVADETRTRVRRFRAR